MTQQQQKTKTGTRFAGLTIGAMAAVLLAIIATAVYAQNKDQATENDRYSLISPGGIAFSDFRGYEDWSVVSSARTEDACFGIGWSVFLPEAHDPLYIAQRIDLKSPFGPPFLIEQS